MVALVRRNSVLAWVRTPFRQGIERDLLETVIGEKAFQNVWRGKSPSVGFSYCIRFL
jgi:hypothetical protein